MRLFGKILVWVASIIGLLTIVFGTIKDGYNIVYSGKTRNSMFVNNLWKRL